MNIQHILVAVDLSDASLVAARYAAAMARSTGAKLTLLHVDESPTINLPDPATMIAFLSHVAEIRNRRLGELIEQLSDESIEINIRAEAGVPSKKILEVANHLLVDLLVITSRGMNATHGPMIGSTTLRVLRRAQLPVLVLNTDGFADIDPTKPLNFERILTTTDFSTDSERGLRVSAGLSQVLGAKLTVTHALRLPLFVPIIPGEAPLHVPQETIDHLREVQEGALAEQIKGLDSDYNVNAEISYGPNVARAILDTSKRLNSDLIIIPTHGKGAIRATLLGSTTLDILSLSTCPVMVFSRAVLAQMSGEAA